MSHEEQRSSDGGVEKIPSQSSSGTESNADPHWPLQHEPHQFADAGAVGLSGFCFTAFVAGLFFARAKSVAIPNAVVGLATFYGGMIEMLCGIWEMAKANTYMATLHTSYGALWISFAAIFIPTFGVAQAYADEPEQFRNALGFFFLAWGLLSFMFFLLSWKTTYPLLATSFLLMVSMFCLTGGYMREKHSASTLKAAGILLIITACCGWYVVYSAVSNRQNTYLSAYPIHLPDFTRAKKNKSEPKA
ncbi:Ammonia transport outward protein 2 [Spathaspora sp. JA1]|nr:Ammonia transport outward protein 2 [Spathaspora sp. JA1]